MEIVITDQGVIFDMTDGQSAINKAVQRTLRVADICRWKLRGMVEVADNRWLVRITGTNAAWERQAFAERLVLELDDRGVAAKVVA